MSRDLAADLDRIRGEQATERARRTRSTPRTREAALPVLVLAVTPREDAPPRVTLAGEAGDYPTAIARACAHVYARAELDGVSALVMVAEGRAHAPESGEIREVVLAASVTLGDAPEIRVTALDATTLDALDTGEHDAQSPLALLLARAAQAADPLRRTRRLFDSPPED